LSKPHNASCYNYNDYHIFFNKKMSSTSEMFFMGTKKTLYTLVLYKKKINQLQEANVKRLHKSRKDKMIDGVCGGIAEYFDVDPVLVRIIFVLFFFFGGAAIIAYIVGMIIMPRKPLELEEGPGGEEAVEKKAPKAEQKKQEPAPAPSTTSKGSLAIGIVLVVIGAFFLMGNFPFFSGFYWWFRGHFWDFLIPGVLIIAGIAVISRGFEK